MLHKSRVACAVALLCAAAALSAGAAEQLSLQHATELAIKNNPSVTADVLSANAARKGVDAARARTNPELFVAPTLLGNGGADALAAVSQPLEINGARRVRTEIATHEAAAASSNSVVTRRDVALRTQQTYWDVVRAQENAALLQQNIENLQTLAKLVQKQVDVGTVPESQLIKTDLELATAQQDLARANLELTQAKSGLNSLLNRPLDTDFAASDPLPTAVDPVDAPALLARALQNRPEIATAQSELSAARGEVKAVQVRQRPDLALQARKESVDGDAGLAVAVTLPVLDWGSVKADKQRAATLVQSQEKRIESTRNEVALDVEEAARALATTSGIVESYRNGIIDKSQHLAEMARKGYEKGATGYLEVLEAQRTQRATKSAYISALADRAKAVAQLQWASTSLAVDGTDQEAK